MGFGFNIPAANHVIHFTRHWNPAKEDQATDRAHRNGQTKDVYVYYPTITADSFVTFEKRLDELLTAKRLLARDMLNGSDEINLKEFRSISDKNGQKIIPDIRITGEHLRLIEADAFEVFCKTLWAKQGYDSSKTGRSGDGGIDVVAISGDRGYLMQCKTTSRERNLGWEAIKDVVAGAADYERMHPGVRFQKISITSASFNDEASRQAVLNGVELYGEKEILGLLLQHPVMLSEVQLES